MRIEGHPGTTLLLVRHGETQWNREERVQGQIDVDLNDRGREQAERLARRLADETLHALYSSDLQRARATAESLRRPPLDVRSDPRLREVGLGVFEGMTVAEIRSAYPREWTAWREDALRQRPPGGETLQDLQARCSAAVAELLPRHAGKTVAIVTHGGAVRVLVCALLGLPLEVYGSLRVENTAVTRIVFGERRTILAGFNDTWHLRDTGVLDGENTEK